MRQLSIYYIYGGCFMRPRQHNEANFTYILVQQYLTKITITYFWLFIYLFYSKIEIIKVFVIELYI